MAMKKFLAILTVLTLLCSMMTFGVSAEDVVTITAENFATEFSAEKATSAKVYKLDDDITVSHQEDNNYFQIFEGSTFDGCGHTITITRTTINGLFTIAQDSDYTTNQKTTFKNINVGTANAPQQVGHGVFLRTEDDTLNSDNTIETYGANKYVDVTWDNINVYVAFKAETNNNHGAFISNNAWGTHEFNNCHVNVTSESTTTAYGSSVGAFIGRCKGGSFTFNNCIADGVISANATAGGFIAKCAGDGSPVATFNNCVNKANVSTIASGTVAGFVGNFNQSGTSVTVANCINYGTIGNTTYGNKVAGIIADGGTNATAIIRNTLNAGNVYSMGSGGNASGIIFKAKSITIEGCANIGTLTGNVWSNGANGLIANLVVGGTISSITNSYGFGKVCDTDSDVVSYILVSKSGSAALATENTLSGNRYLSGGAVAEATDTNAQTVDANGAIELLKASAFKYLNFTNDNGTIKVSTVDNGLVGAQLGSNDTAVRILGVVDSLDYAGVGFKVSVTNGGNTILAETEFYCTTVYSSVIADGETIHSSQLGGTYIVALTLNDIQAGDIITVSALTGNTPTTYFTYNGSELVASVG